MKYLIIQRTEDDYHAFFSETLKLDGLEKKDRVKAKELDIECNLSFTLDDAEWIAVEVK